MADGALTLAELPEVQYCIPVFLRDIQVAEATRRPIPRLQPHPARPLEERAAIVCFGPSLNETWQQVRDGNFSAIFTCSGAHKFLRDRGVTPTHHVEVDPRPHKVGLIGEPSPQTLYLIASTCHREVFDHLADYQVRLWHVFSNEDEALRVLPPGEWACTGGSSVGLRALTMARVLGYRALEVFGMDGCEGSSGKHAAEHPNQPPVRKALDYKGVTYWTTESMAVCAMQTAHELDEMPDVVATFHGEGLVQALMRDYVRKPPTAATVAFTKGATISAEYAALNAQLHASNHFYGVGGSKHVKTVEKLVASLSTSLKRHPSVLDYGCGKGLLAKGLSFPIWEYDPAIPEKAAPPRPADLVICTDVLEHVEPERLHLVLADLARCVKAVGYFVIHTTAAHKCLPDGRNTHLIQQPGPWWRNQLQPFFEIRGNGFVDAGSEVRVVVGPRKDGRARIMASAVRAVASEVIDTVG